MVVETCDLHMGTDLQYSVRIGTDSRDAADGLCAKPRRPAELASCRRTKSSFRPDRPRREDV